MELLNGPHLFDSMYLEDPEGTKLSTLPGVDDMLRVRKLLSRSPSQFVEESQCSNKYLINQKCFVLARLYTFNVD